MRSLCRAPQFFRATSILSDSSTSGGKAVESLVVPARSLFGYGGRSQSRVLGEVDTQVFELQGQLQNSNNTGVSVTAALVSLQLIMSSQTAWTSILKQRKKNGRVALM